MTYTALLSLLILGDNLQQVHRAAVLQAIRSLQCPDGRWASNFMLAILGLATAAVHSVHALAKYCQVNFSV